MRKYKNASRKWVVTAVCILVAVSVATTAFAQSRRPIIRPSELGTKEQITRFILTVLEDRSNRNDPFVRSTRSGNQAVQYENVVKPRPVSGFGKYDVDTLVLMAIWRQNEKIVAMVSTPDDKSFVVKIGDEAYDGKVIEINADLKYVKFLEEIKRMRTSGPESRSKLETTFQEHIVRFRK